MSLKRILRKKLPEIPVKTPKSSITNVIETTRKGLLESVLFFVLDLFLDCYYLQIAIALMKVKPYLTTEQSGISNPGNPQNIDNTPPEDRQCQTQGSGILFSNS